MALPVTITGISTAVATVGPFQSSGGNYYFFGRDGATATTLQAFKSAAPDTSWASVATKTGFTTAILNLASYQVGDVVHIMVQDGTASTALATKYVSFNLANDTFLATVETVSAAVAVTGQVAGAGASASLVVRSNGEAVAFYNGVQTKTSSTFRARVYYRRRTAVNTWSTETQVDGNTGVDNTNPFAILGAADRVHFVWSTQSGVGTRTLSAANALNTAATSASLTSPGDGASYGRGGVTKVVVTSNSGGQSTMRFDSADNPTNSFANQNIAAASAPHRIGSDPATGDVTIVYRSTADSDLYAIKSSDDGATFGAPVSFFVGTVANVDANLSRNATGGVYTRGSNAVVGYIVNDNGTLKYNESILRSVINSGALTVTEVGDAAAAAATAQMLAALAATEVGDTAAVNGLAGRLGALAITEVGDTASASGTVFDTVTGAFAATEDGDTASGAGNVAAAATGGGEVWSDTDHGPTWSVSNGGRTATCDATGTTAVCLRSVSSHSTGKYHFELAVTTVGAFIMVGFASAAHGLNCYLGFGPSLSPAVDSAGNSGAHFWYYNGNPLNEGLVEFDFRDGDIVALEIDFDNSFYRIQNLTHGSGWSADHDLTGWTGPWFLALESDGNSVVVLNAGQEAFAVTPTAGFGPWAPLGPPADAVGALAATEVGDSAALTGAVLQPVTGALAATEAADSADISATIPLDISAALAATEAADTASFAGSVPVSPIVIWGAAGGNIFVSNGGLDAAGNVPQSSVRAVQSHASGLWYCEIEVTVIHSNSGYTSFGIMDATTASGSGLDSPPAPNTAQISDGTATGALVNGFVANTSDMLAAAPVGTYVGIAVNCDTQECYFSQGGVWIGSSNPVSRANPRFTWTANPGRSIYPSASLLLNTVRIHGNASNQLYAAPTGYTAWGDSAGVADVTGTLAATEAADTAAVTGGVVATGTLAAIEAADTAGLAATAAWLAALAATEAADTASLAGGIVAAAALAATEAADSASIAASVRMLAALAANELPDTAAMVGGIVATGTLAATETADAAAFSASVRMLAALAATEAADAAHLTGGIVATGSLAATEAADSDSFTAGIYATGTLAVGEPADTAAFAVAIVTAATLAVIEAPDQFDGLGSIIGAGIGANLEATEAPDAAAFAAQVHGVGAALAATEAADIAALSGSARMLATLAANEAGDTAALTATTRWVAALAATEAADVAAINAVTRMLATLAANEAPDVAVLSGAARMLAALAAAEAPDTADSAASVRMLATLAVSEAADTASFSASIIATAALAATEASDTAAFSSDLRATGTLAATEAPDTAAISAFARTSGALAAIEAADIAAIVGGAVATGILAASEAPDSIAFAGLAGRLGTLDATEAQDRALFSTDLRSSGDLAATEPPDVVAVSATARWLAVLSASESADTASVVAESVTGATLEAAEPPDHAAISAGAVGAGALDATEAPDIANMLARLFAPNTLAGYEDPDIARFNAGEIKTWLIEGVRSPPLDLAAQRSQIAAITGARNESVKVAAKKTAAAITGQRNPPGHWDARQ